MLFKSSYKHSTKQFLYSVKLLLLAHLLSLAALSNVLALPPKNIDKTIKEVSSNNNHDNFINEEDTLKNAEDIRFTGGDSLTGIEKIYHEIMMKNELHDGKGAYKLSYDGGKGGPSFGGNQMNIAVNKKAREILIDIITNAKGKVPNLTLSDSEIVNIKEKLMPTNKSKQKSLSNDLKGSATKVFSEAQAIEINKILKSDYGRQKLDQVYVPYIKEKAKKIERIVKNIKQPSAKEFYSTDYGKALLFDYEIQYGIIESGPEAKLVNFLNTGKTTTHTGKELKFIH